MNTESDPTSENGPKSEDGPKSENGPKPEDVRSLLARLLHRIAPEVDLDDVDPDAALQEAMDLDSMDFLNLVTALHEQTGIEVPERDYPSLGSVNGFVAYVEAASAH